MFSACSFMRSCLAVSKFVSCLPASCDAVLALGLTSFSEVSIRITGEEPNSSPVVGPPISATTVSGSTLFIGVVLRKSFVVTGNNSPVQGFFLGRGKSKSLSMSRPNFLALSSSSLYNSVRIASTSAGVVALSIFELPERKLAPKVSSTLFSAAVGFAEENIAVTTLVTFSQANCTVGNLLTASTGALTTRDSPAPKAIVSAIVLSLTSATVISASPVMVAVSSLDTAKVANAAGIVPLGSIPTNLLNPGFISISVAIFFDLAAKLAAPIPGKASCIISAITATGTLAVSTFPTSSGRFKSLTLLWSFSPPRPARASGKASMPLARSVTALLTISPRGLVLGPGITFVRPSGFVTTLNIVKSVIFFPVMLLNVFSLLSCMVCNSCFNSFILSLFSEVNALYSPDANLTEL